MRRHGWTIVLVAVVILLLLLYSSAFVVDFRQIAIVETFGKASTPIHGSTHAGLYWKWPVPVQSLVRYDARTHTFEDTSDQVPTSDQQNVIISVFCGWRIMDADKFLRKVKTVKVAEERLRTLVRDRKKSVISDYVLASFVNTDKKLMLMGEMEQRMLEGVSEKAAEEYGIEVKLLGFRSLVVAQKVSEKIIENMKWERNEKADRYRSLGQAVADAVESRAAAARKQILAFASALAKNIYAEGIAAAAEHYGTFRKNERFAAFLRRLDFIKQAFAENTIFLLDPSVEAGIAFFKDGASLDPGGESRQKPPKKPGKQP